MNSTTAQQTKMPTRIPRRNETTQQRLTRLMRERENRPHHEDYEDGNPDREMRVRHSATLRAQITPEQLRLIGEESVKEAEKNTGKKWTYTLVCSDGTMRLSLDQVE